MPPDRFNDRRLRETALKAFVKSLHTDRMVAVTGAMSTRALGYPSWDDFIKAYAFIAGALAEEICNERRGDKDLEKKPTGILLEDIKSRAKILAERERKSPEEIDPRVEMWTLHDSFRSLDREMWQVRSGLVIDHEYQTPAVERLEKRVAAMFSSRTLGAEPLSIRPAGSAVRPLIESLGIKRIATLNYDLELERAFMLRGDERDLLGEADDSAAKRNYEELPPGAGTKAEMFAAKGMRLANARLVGIKSANASMANSVEHFIGGQETGKPIVRAHRNRLSRTMSNGVHVESDIVDRERPDRLFEFAVGSAETDRHILHLHGRSDVPSSLVANIHQYNRLYRLDDLYRDPFDHSLRVLFGGNPILFVGIGMTEEELNGTLQYFVSNIPVRRPAPMFVLWNTIGRGSTEKEEYMQDRRLDFWVRLGVHLVFDDDILQPGEEFPDLVQVTSGDELEKEKLKALAEMMAKLPKLVMRVDRRVDRTDRWRSIEHRLKITEENKDFARMWGARELGVLAQRKRFDFTKLAMPEVIQQEERAQRVIIAAAPVGFGRGELGEQILQMESGGIAIDQVIIQPTEPKNRLLINAGFSYDSFAMLNGVEQFLTTRLHGAPARGHCRERLIADDTLFQTRENVLIVVNGADRFFGSDGTPLSAELDHMLRCALGSHGRVQILMLGTDRLRHYCETIGIQLQRIAGEAAITLGTSQASGGDRSPGGRTPLNSSYLDWVVQRYQARAEICRVDPPSGRGRALHEHDFKITDAAAAHIARAIDIDRGALNRAFYEAYLSPALLKNLGINCPATFEVLRTLCFIGAPIEANVLLHAPKVRAILAEDSEAANPGTDLVPTAKLGEKLERVIQDLIDLGLLIQLKAHQPDPSDKNTRPAVANDPADPTLILETAKVDLWGRVGLHRSLATFLRDRHGAPINDAKLATTFNMSLFMSEPSDNYTPEPDFYDELGDLVDSLIGGWHDLDQLHQEKKYQNLPTGRIESYDSESLESDIRQLYIHHKDREYVIRTLGLRSSKEASACLRAALSLVRGYYSTGALLKIDRSDRTVTAERDGALTEHAQRLDRLITGFGDISTARRIVRNMFGEAAAEAAADFMGPDPFYADDLVWLHNERGVVALVQGHMFDARDAFSAANRVNNQFVECEYRGHNWRRISINQVATQIERGTLKPAERLLDQIEVAIDNAAWRRKGQPQQAGRVAEIRSAFQSREEVSAVLGSRSHTREEMLIVAMTTSYRGLIADMRGRYHEAREQYETGIRILRRLEEHRALAHFQRHYASLHSFIGEKQLAAREISYAINAAQSAKQMDILHRSRVVRANLWRSISTDPIVRRQALQDMKDALTYAALSDCYRVRIEASASLARHMRHGGDYDTALRYATDALTIASRYGHSLQKTSLRVEIGQILKARGDPISGEALLDQAIAIGTSKGYQQILERVRRARNTLAASQPMPNRTDIPVIA